MRILKHVNQLHLSFFNIKKKQQESFSSFKKEIYKSST
jgi:hypothetical protein